MKVRLEIHLDSCDICDSSDSSVGGDSSNSRQEQTCLQDFTTVCISNRHSLGFVGHGSVACWPLVCSIGPNQEYGEFPELDVVLLLLQNYTIVMTSIK